MNEAEGIVMKFKLEHELGLSLDGVYGMKLLDQFEFNLVSKDTQAFIILVEIFLTEFGWDKLHHLSEFEFKEKVFEAHLYAGCQLDSYNPVKTAIKAVKDYMQYVDRIVFD